MPSILQQIQSPQDVKALTRDQLKTLAEDIRHEILTVTSKNGGHVGPNLGVVELTLALHRIFSTPEDKFIFDVAHQGYVHKLLTGRQGHFFHKIRQTGGASGFLTRDESPHDAYGAGHAGTALSAALGMAKARDMAEKSNHVIAVLGDAALTCGITLEAMNNINHTTRRLIVILNDNEWSIAKNVGALAQYLNKLITQPKYIKINKFIGKCLKKLPKGEMIRQWAGKIKQETKDLITPTDSSFFETYGLRYIGPIDGHHLDDLLYYLNFCKNADEPILLHVITQKGRGYPGAIQNPEKFHGTSPFELATGQSKPTAAGTPPNYQDVFGKTLTQLAQNDPRIIALTAAMPNGTGLSHFSKTLPHQFIDVGIAEEHAVLKAAGLAIEGMKPVCAIYSTFLQRAFDPIVHDICLQKLPVVFCMDRAGLSPNDGPTHHGLFDIGYLRIIPNACIMQPKDEAELSDMLYTCLQHPGPTFMRYPRGTGLGAPIKQTPQLLPIGQAEVLQSGTDICLWAIGPMVEEALELAYKLEKEAGLSVNVTNARFIKPLDNDLLISQAQSAQLIVTLEDHVVTGGFGSAILETLNDHGLNIPLLRIGWPDHFIPHASNVADLRQQAHLHQEALYARIITAYKNVAV